MGKKIGRSRVISKFVFLKASPSERLGKLHAYPSSEEHNKHDFYKKMKDIERFIRGFRQFQEDYFNAENAPFEPLKQGQSPKTMLIGCSDSRVDPAILTQCAPGDIFVVRNVANLAPPYEQGPGLHGVRRRWSMRFAAWRSNTSSFWGIPNAAVFKR